MTGPLVTFARANYGFSTDKPISASQQGHEPEDNASHATDGGDQGMFSWYTTGHCADPRITDSGNVGLDHMDDPADIADANAFEIITQDQNFGPVTLEHSPPRGCLLSMPLPDTIEPETRNSEARSSLFIDRFPHGHPGAPVSGIGQASIFEATCNGLGDSIWAPFRSQCDWEIARWAKMRGPTSTAVTELLAIPEV